MDERKSIFLCSDEEIVRLYSIPEIEYYIDAYGDYSLIPALELAEKSRQKWAEEHVYA